MEPIGLYIHFPFCATKCPYCDFYSAPANDETMDAYTDALEAAVRSALADGRQFGTVYFGGGTPSLLGAKRLTRIADLLRTQPIREFTVECNPSRVEDGLFEALASSGVTRISMGLQSAVDAERRALGRTADARTVERRVMQAYHAGIKDLSLDLMLGIPGQTSETLRKSLEFCVTLPITHVSAYLLKIEPGTPFFRRRETLDLPDEDAVCTLYLETVNALEDAGLHQYEISNFARTGHVGQHNLQYWDDREYLGIGPAAHSFADGKRFYYPRDTVAFLRGDPPIPDGDGGSFAEYAMLRLRLTEGLTRSGVRSRFGTDIPVSLYARAERMPKHLLTADQDGIRLSPEGFLLSNTILADILKEVL